MCSIDYERYAKDFGNWYNNEEFIGMRSVTELSLIFDLCLFSTKQFFDPFTIISNKFKFSEVHSIMQHAKIGNFENTETAFEILNFISRILNNRILLDISTFIKLQKAESQPNVSKNIKFLLDCQKNSSDFDKIYDILLNCNLYNDTNAIKFACMSEYTQVTDKYGSSFLLYAAQRNNIDAVKFFLSLPNADIYAINRNGISALQHALNTDNAELMKILVSHSNFNAKYYYKDGGTILHHAVQENKIEVVKCLCSIPSIDVNAKDQYSKKTPLHYAIQENYHEILKYMCSNSKIDINSKDENNMTPLHYAAQTNNLEVARIICSRIDVDLNAIDDNKMTPLIYAAKFNSTEVIKYLSFLPKINFTATDDQDKSAYDYSNENNNAEAVNILSIHHPTKNNSNQLHSVPQLN